MPRENEAFIILQVMNLYTEDYTAKLSPQPQLLLALGLLK